MRCGLLPPTRYDFYPRPPRGGRPCSCRRRVPPAGISIHALREEGDITVLIPNTYSKTFLSTPSARRATVGKIKAQGAALFLSTPSARRATYKNNKMPFAIKFLSTPSARRATLEPMNISEMVILFLSTPSARRATTQVRGTEIRSEISIHALREEGDYAKGRKKRAPAGFLSTPSARRATTSAWCAGAAVRHFYPRPPRGGRPDCYFITGGLKRISIHALREEGDIVATFDGLRVYNFYPRPPRGGRHPRKHRQRQTV